MIDVIDPAVRPIVPAEAAQGPVPEYSAAEIVELLQLISPLRLWDNVNSKWRVVDVSLPTLRANRAEYVSDLQDKADAVWRSSGAYAQAVEKAAAAAIDAAADREYDRRKAAAREAKMSGRFTQLIDHGLGPREAAAQVAAEFPESDR